MKKYSLSVSSTVESIRNLRFNGLPRENSLDVIKIARHGDVVLFMGRDNLLYSRGVTFSGHFVFGRGRMDDYIRAAAKIGVVSMADVRAHLKAASEFDAQMSIRRKAKQFVKDAVNLGVVLNQKQLRKLKVS